jgi:hypothetical protein
MPDATRLISYVMTAKICNGNCGHFRAHNGVFGKGWFITVHVVCSLKCFNIHDVSRVGSAPVLRWLFVIILTHSAMHDIEPWESRLAHELYACPGYRPIHFLMNAEYIFRLL